jgi:hypothetical protein
MRSVGLTIIKSEILFYNGIREILCVIEVEVRGVVVPCLLPVSSTYGRRALLYLRCNNIKVKFVYAFDVLCRVYNGKK